MSKDARSELRRTVAQLADLAKKRDELIRQAIADGVRVADLAQDAGLSVFRIYQIRDGRR